MLKRQYIILLFSLLGLLGFGAYYYWPHAGHPPFLSIRTSSIPLNWRSELPNRQWAQLACLQVETADFADDYALQQYLETYQPGALEVRGAGSRQLLRMLARLQPMVEVPFLPGSAVYPALGNLLADGYRLPSFSRAPTLGDPEGMAERERLSLQQSQLAGLGFRVLPAGQFDPEVWNEAGILAFASLEAGIGLDTAFVLRELQARLQPLIEQGLAGIYIDKLLWERLPIAPVTWKLFLRETLEFRGLVLGDYSPTEGLSAQAAAGIDLWRVPTPTMDDFLEQMREEVYGSPDRPQWRERVVKVWKAKEWVGRRKAGPRKAGVPVQQASLRVGHESPSAKLPIDSSRALLLSRWEHLAWEWTRESGLLAANPNDLLPLGRMDSLKVKVWGCADSAFVGFSERISRYTDIEYASVDLQQQPLQPLRPQKLSGTLHVVLLDLPEIDPAVHGAFIRSIRHLATQQPVVLVQFGPLDQLRFWGKEAGLIHFSGRGAREEALAADMLVGAFSPQGRLPYSVSDEFLLGQGLTFGKVRLQEVPPEAAGIAPEKLVGIDAIAHSAIDERIFPGCQVAVAYRGDIIYSKAFGTHTYASDARPVRKTDLYDLASITKVAATTLMAMELYEREELDLRRPLGRYLSLPADSRLSGIPLSRLLTHQSGLQANLPVFGYIKGKRRPRVDCGQYFCDQPGDGRFGVEVARSLFFADRWVDSIRQSTLAIRPRYGKRYRYSDLNFYLLQQVLEKQSGESLDQWTKRHIYAPLGLKRTLFRPLQKFPEEEIIPTELDKKWRKQLVHGHVHDEAAALLGGVSGHAGLFSNAEELAVLFQLLLNKGTYGRVRAFQPKTVQLFTDHFRGAARGLGFDKPAKWNETTRSFDLTDQAFGHTGFTGTCVWVDPEQELVYVFLSNRVHPRANNRKIQEEGVRRRIHQVVYDALGSRAEESPLQPEWYLAGK